MFPHAADLLHRMEKKSREVRDFNNNNSLQPVMPLSHVTHNSCVTNSHDSSHSWDIALMSLPHTSPQAPVIPVLTLSLRISALYQDRWERSRGMGEIWKRLSGIMQQSQPLLPYHWAELAVHWFSHFWGLHSHQRCQVTIMIGFRGSEINIKILLLPLLTPSHPSLSFLIYDNQCIYHR